MRFILISLYFISALLLKQGSPKQTCGVSHVHSLFLQLGDSGSFIPYRERTFQDNTVTYCTLELVTCPFCYIEITITRNTSSSLCNKQDEKTDDCPCGRILICEMIYAEQILDICSVEKFTIYNSTSRSIRLYYESGIDYSNISTHHSEDVFKHFKIQYKSSKNQEIIKGAINDSGYVYSPNFPLLYPRDFGAEHIFYCESDDCIVGVIFSDFLVSSSSIMEFFDWNGRLIAITPGNRFRPPYVLSTGPTLAIRFFANGGSSLGYKMKYTFLNATMEKKIKTECGGEIRDQGGNIFMYNVIGLHECYWIIKPTTSLSFFKTHLSVKILDFDTNGEITIHESITSESNEILKVSNHNYTKQEVITSISNGFYIHLTADFKKTSRLIIAYSAFSELDCIPKFDFKCNNSRCIVKSLKCNGVDNCGDNSDEQNDCVEIKRNDISYQYWWPTKDANTNEFSDSRYLGGLWMCGVIFVTAVLLFFISMCRRPFNSTVNNNQVDTINDQIQTITQLLSVEELSESDEPPMYEPPPDYKEAIKYQKKTLCKKKKSQGTYDVNTKNTGHNKTACNIVETTSNSTLRRRGSEGSLPLSLETAEYDDRQTENVEDNAIPWISGGEILTDTAVSAISFDALQSNQDQVINPLAHALVKRNSQENVFGSSSSANCAVTGHNHTYDLF